MTGYPRIKYPGQGNIFTAWTMQGNKISSALLCRYNQQLSGKVTITSTTKQADRNCKIKIWETCNVWEFWLNLFNIFLQGSCYPFELRRADKSNSLGFLYNSSKTLSHIPSGYNTAVNIKSKLVISKWKYMKIEEPNKR